MSCSIQCVHCQAVLKSPTPVPAGKSVKCPKCKQSFTTPAQEPAPVKSHAVQCIHCQAVLKSPTPVPAGKKVTCPKCKQSFTTPAEAKPAVPPPEKPVPKAPAPSLNISIFTGDADAAIAGLMAEAHGKAEPQVTLPELDDDELVTEEDAAAAKQKAPEQPK